MKRGARGESTPDPSIPTYPDELISLATPTEDNLPTPGKHELIQKAYKAITGNEPGFDLNGYFDTKIDKKKREFIPDTTPLPYLNLSEEPKDMEWLIQGWLAKQDIILFAGRAGAGKSTTAAELAIALAGGRNGSGFLGIHIDTPFPVIYLDEEAGANEMLRLMKRLGATGPDHPKDLHIVSCQNLSLGSDEAIAKIEQAIIDKNPALVVLDTASHFFAGGDENNAAEVARMFKPLFRLREKYGTSFLIVHHLRKPPSTSYNGSSPSDDLLDRVRGSTAFTTQASAVWTAVQSADGGYVDLAMQKRRGGKKLSMRVKYEEYEGRIHLSNLGEPEKTETALDQCSRFIVASMQADLRETWSTKDLVHHAEKNGHCERIAKGALAHLVAVGALHRPTKGIYTISKMIDRPSLDI